MIRRTADLECSISDTLSQLLAPNPNLVNIEAGFEAISNLWPDDSARIRDLRSVIRDAISVDLNSVEDPDCAAYDALVRLDELRSTLSDEALVPASAFMFAVRTERRDRCLREAPCDNSFYRQVHTLWSDNQGYATVPFAVVRESRGFLLDCHVFRLTVKSLLAVRQFAVSITNSNVWLSGVSSGCSCMTLAALANPESMWLVLLEDVPEGLHGCKPIEGCSFELAALLGMQAIERQWSFANTIAAGGTFGTSGEATVASEDEIETIASKLTIAKRSGCDRLIYAIKPSACSTNDQYEELVRNGVLPVASLEELKKCGSIRNPSTPTELPSGGRILRSRSEPVPADLRYVKSMSPHDDEVGLLPGKVSFASSPHNLPIRPLSLIGRDRMLADLTIQFNPSIASRPQRRILTGLDGIGKTTVAVELAYRVLPHYPGGAWFLDGRNDPDAEMARLGEVLSFHPPYNAKLPQFGAAVDRDLLAGLTRTALQNSEHPALLVLDEPASTSWAEALPANVAVLATRCSELRSLQANVVEVPPLSPDDALQLSNAVGATADPVEDEARKSVVVSSLGCHPLAILIATTTVATLHLTWEEFAGELDMNPGELEVDGRSLQSVFDLAMQGLADDELTILRACVAFGGEPVPLAWLASAAGHPPIGLAFRQKLRDLSDRALLSFDRSNVRMHTLVARCVKWRVPDACWTQVAQTCWQVSKDWIEGLTSAPTIEEIDERSVHLHRLLRHLDEASLYDEALALSFAFVELADITGHRSVAINYCARALDAIQTRGQPANILDIVFLECRLTGLQIATGAPVKWRPDEKAISDIVELTRDHSDVVLRTSALLVIGNLAHLLGYHSEARLICEEALGLLEGNNAPSALFAAVSKLYAISLSRVGQRARAGVVLKKALNALGSDQTAIAAMVCSTLAGLTPNQQRAVAHAERALRIYRSCQAGSMAEAVTLDLLGAIHFRLGNLNTSIERHEEALAIAKRWENYGYENDVGRISVQLAIAYYTTHEQAWISRAVQLFEVAEKIGLRLSDTVDWLPRCYSHHALALDFAGESERAMRLAKSAVELAHRRAGDGSIEFGNANRHYAIVLSRNGEYDSAWKTFETALGCLRRFASSDPSWAQCAIELTNMRFETGELKHVADMYRDVGDVIAVGRLSGEVLSPIHSAIAAGLKAVWSVVFETLNLDYEVELAADDLRAECNRLSRVLSPRPDSEVVEVTVRRPESNKMFKMSFDFERHSVHLAGGLIPIVVDGQEHSNLSLELGLGELRPTIRAATTTEVPKSE